MSTVLRTALTATLALSASFVLVKSPLLPAAEFPLGCSSEVLRIKDWVHSTIYPAAARPLRHFAEPAPISFDPQPNLPPLRTEGSGTR